MTTNGSEVAPLINPLQIHVDSFLDHLQSNGYAPQSVANTRSIAIAFARRSQGALIGVEDLHENHLAAFVMLCNGLNRGDETVPNIPDPRELPQLIS